MSAISTPTLGLSRVMLKIFIVLNVIAGIGVALGLVGSFIFEVGLMDYYRERVIDDGLVILALRGILLLAIPFFAAIYVLLTRLLAIVETVGAGDPFVPENAARLKTIAWCILVMQVFNLAAGAFAAVIKSADAHIDWDLDFNGWLMVVLAFVLARVFEEGTRMRNDLQAMI
ncbi:DUF2975 domain-containing protein [Caulobacter sp. SLTY]|uniref:DUF2975 domain-containing protein n=1 Tax=Caulobacter sp. SLTY TaxID=2683262 RepID=UPI0014122DEC|nr:DUF2975 domain-containing protein [Caulobacter sp. SLTY]NBB15409.1 DUF2975 domain-containing protein [Caulobacter sp. SLTY]